MEWERGGGEEEEEEEEEGRELQMEEGELEVLPVGRTELGEGRGGRVLLTRAGERWQGSSLPHFHLEPVPQGGFRHSQAALYKSPPSRTAGSLSPVGAAQRRTGGRVAGGGWLPGPTQTWSPLAGCSPEMGAFNPAGRGRN